MNLFFANPSWLHALWGVLAVLALLIWLDARGSAALERFLDASMRLRLTQRLPRGRRWLSLALLGLSSVMLIVALMRPQGALTYHALHRVGAQIMVCLDVSKSMLAEDTAPNRLERAKVELSDLLTYLEGDQVGLITFAGKASVLCPLTPDYGFFRLILEGAGPHSVGRGGTRLEAPIRKALEGFRSESDVSRIILLITDGEDHDSYPVKAAEAAAERGIHIITIGFGDEAGSEIRITDPDTGVRSVLMDGSGQPVVTRLDGETLREVALVTEGVYVPAGTGALQLESIYEAHIAPLTRGDLDDRGHSVRSEYFQWAILASLILLFAAVAVVSGSASPISVQRQFPGTPAKSAAALLALALGLCQHGATPLVRAQSPDAQTAGKIARPPDSKADASAASGDSPAERAPSPPDEPEDPREIYNQALAHLSTDLDRADRLLTDARQQSGTDGEVRFRSTYNLGWVEVHRADRQLEENPEQALVHLREAANWFGDAVRLRPEHRDARHNLELIMRRILELADSLRDQDDRDLATRLDELIQTQRQLISETSGIVQQVAQDDDPNLADRFRVEFRRLAVEQRKVLSDSQALAESAREEFETAQAADPEATAPEERIRVAQLAGVMHYLNQANQRMGQARSQMRRQQGARAFRRSSAALDELKRARDQLRDPVQLLGVLLSDAMQTAGYTSALAASERLGPVADQPAPEPPAWLTCDYLEQSQQSITDRSTELTTRLQAGMESQEKKPAGPPTAGQMQQEVGTERLVKSISEAMPFLREANDAFAEAGSALQREEPRPANRDQLKAVVALQKARERFLDLRGLIELTHANETQVQSLLSAEEPSPFPPSETIAAAQQIQAENLLRAQRLAVLLDEDRQLAASTGDSPQPGTGADPANQDARVQQLELARQLLTEAQGEMTAAGDVFAGRAATPNEKQPGEGATAAGEAKSEEEKETPDVVATVDRSPEVQEARNHVEQAIDRLQSLRRLFFSVVEHLRETAQRQAQLNDETEETATLQDSSDAEPATGPLAARQQELQNISEQISKALLEQSQQAPEGPAAEEHQQQMTAALSTAGQMVSEGAAEMEQAVESMNSDPLEWKPIREHQDTAFEKLAEALALLVPPEQPPQEQQSQEQNEQDEDQQQEQPQQAGADPSRLLQAVRDREAARRKNKSQRPAGYEPVEKDW